MVIAKKRRLVSYTGILAVLSGFAVAACNVVLGIGEATHDPTLDDGGADSGGTGGHDAGADSGGNGNDCATYCSIIGQACTGTNAEYISDQVCHDMCATFDPGQPGDTSGDSLACRITYAKKAAADPLTYCQASGPLAGGCTKPCDAFCLIAYNECNADMLFPYDGGVKECEASCANYPYLLSSPDAGNAGDGGDAGGSVGDILFIAGDTLNCRIYHLESAFNATITNAVKVHCPHTAADSATCN